MATAAQRVHLATLMDYLISKEPRVHYPAHDVRGSADQATFVLTEREMRAYLDGSGSITFDCSQAVTQLCRWAGLHDPNGLRYSHAGYTGTLLAHLSHYQDPGKAKVGALVVYGPATGDHVSMVHTPGGDPLLWSHGFEGGPQLLRLSEQRQFHRPPVTLLSIAHL